VKSNNNIKSYYEKINLNNRTFSLVMVLTSFTTETNNIILHVSYEMDIIGGTSAGNMKLDIIGGTSAG
jgi:hypothetical protein